MVALGIRFVLAASPILNAGWPVYVAGFAFLAYLYYINWWTKHRVERGLPFDYRVQTLIAAVACGLFFLIGYLDFLHIPQHSSSLVWPLILIIGEIAWTCIAFVSFRRSNRLAEAKQRERGATS